MRDTALSRAAVAVASQLSYDAPDRLFVDRLALSISTFTPAFRASFGTSAHRYVLLRRLDRACAPLLSNDRHMPEIAFLCGFFGQSHMTRHFRVVSKLTPAALRRSRRV
jgi:transcriptional regulator GlxA family with amidase domain